jgi:hypothetical protein
VGGAGDAQGVSAHVGVSAVFAELTVACLKAVMAPLRNVSTTLPFLTAITLHVSLPRQREVLVKSAVFGDIKTQFVPHRTHITSPLQNPTG